MAIDWNAFQTGLEGDIKTACKEKNWDTFAQQLASAIRVRMEAVISNAEVTHAQGTVIGTAPPPLYFFVDAYAVNGTIT